MSEHDRFIQYDNILLGILQNCGKIEPFLEVIFSFLARRTDYFLWMHSKDDKLGFPPGIAEKMVIKIFEKYQETVLKHEPSYKDWKRRNIKAEKKIESSTKEEIPTPIQEVEVRSEEAKSNNLSIKNNTSNDGNDVTEINRTESTTTSTEESKVSTNEKLKKTENIATIHNDKESKEPSSKEVQNIEKSASAVSSDAFNGGVTEKYTWSQTLTDIDIKIPIPSHVKKSKDVTVTIKHDSINVSLKSNPPSSDCQMTSNDILHGTLSHRIKTEESIWSLEPSKNITITLEKSKEKWWTCVLEGDEEIDKQKIDTTQNIHDFDDQTQGDIRKVMHDQHQKMIGKPTSEEQKTYDMLEKAWDAEGSPFRGTPFDPSKVNVGGGGGFPGPTE